LIGSGSNSRIKVLWDVISIYLKYNPFFNVFRDSPHGATFYHNYVHQMYLMSRVVYQRPVRVMVADEIGLGKTVEAIRVIKHLMYVDGIKKILIVVPPILLDQWIEKDLGNLGIRPRIVNRESIMELYEVARAGMLSDGVYIGSMDTLKLSSTDDVEITHYPYFEFVSAVDWDLVVIDEAHKLSYIGSSPSLRYEKLGSQICRKNSKHCLLLTATPHRGQTKDFLARIALLDKSFLPRPSELEKIAEKHGLRPTLFQLITDVLFFRRIKEDVNKIEEKQIFKQAHQYPVLIHVPEDIRKLQLKILDFVTLGLDRYYVDPKFRGIRELLRKLIIKRAMSSEQALLNTFMRIGARREGVTEEDLKRLERRLENYLTGEEEGELEVDKEVEEFFEIISSFIEPQRIDKLKSEIEGIVQQVRRIMEEGRSPKVNALADIVELALGKALGEHEHVFKDVVHGKILVFTEFKDTAEQIFTQLKKTLERRIGRVPLSFISKVRNLEQKYAQFLVKQRGELSRYLNIIPTNEGRLIGIGLLTSESKRLLPVFQRMLNDKKLDTAVLISTDVAAEGLNMQAANVVINYEVIWSPLKRDQRIGRIWRLGQEREVYVFDFHMGTDFERSILENFTVKIITIAEETGYTTVQYKGLAFYLPYSTAEEETEYALRVVEMEKFSESAVLENFAIALRRAISHIGEINTQILGEELSRLAIEIIRFTRQLKKELESISKYRVDPERVKREVRLLLGFGSGDEARESFKDLVRMFADLCQEDVIDMDEVMFIGGTKVLKNSLRDLVYIADKLIEKYSFKEQMPHLFLVKEKEDFDDAFLTFIAAETNTHGVLYSEPVIIMRTKSGVKVLRGIEFTRTLLSLIRNSVPTKLNDTVLNALKSRYVDAARSTAYILSQIRSIIHEKPNRFIESYELSSLRESKPSMIPNGQEPILKFYEQPHVIFMPAPYLDQEESKTEEAERIEPGEIPVVFPRGKVSPEKKESVKTIAENLVKAYFESMGYKCIKRGEMFPFDFELYDENGKLMSYVEVKGHESDELVVELSQNEEVFARQHIDNYIVCVVTNVFTSPKITCVTYKDLKRIKIYLEKTVKYLYKVKQ